MEPLVSIIIPFYNARNYLLETLDSCLTQSHSNLEIILVNDGSTDDSVDIIQNVEDRRVKYYGIPNSGPCYARNFGVSKASGELFQFLDADDVLEKDKIKAQVKSYWSKGEEYIYSGVMGTIIKNKKCLEQGLDFYYEDLDRMEYFNRMFNNFGKYFTTGIWMVPRKLLEGTHGWDQEVLINNDGEYFSRLILASKGIVFSPGAIFYYRRDVPESLSKKFHSKRIYKSWLYSYTCYVQSFKANLDDGNAKELGRRALSVYYCNSYPHYPDLLADCKEQIRLLGYNSPAAHGGKIFKFLAGIIGTDNALRIRTLKAKGITVFNRLKDDGFFPQQTISLISKK